MSNEQKQFDLEKYHAILLATLDYLEEHFGRTLIYDDINPITAYYREQKIQIEKNFKQRRLDRLQKRFINLTENLKHRADLKFSPYIKEKTGYDIDIFDDLHKRIGIVFIQNKISNQKELKDVFNVLALYKQNSGEEEKYKKLNELLINYTENQCIDKKSKSNVIKREARTIDKESEEVTITELTSIKPKHFEEEVQISPDGKRKVRTTQWADKNHETTYVSVDFPTASSPVYGATGINPLIKAWWKDNSTIVIKTSKQLSAHTQCKKIGSFDDVITIEYIER